MKDNYVYDGTNVLMNLAGIKDQKKLDDFETTMANLGIIKLLKEYPDLGNVEDIAFLGKNKKATFKEKNLRYSMAKLCNILCVYEMADRLRKINSKITVNAFNPGLMTDTNFMPPMNSKMLNNMIKVGSTLVAKTTNRYGSGLTSGKALSNLITEDRFEGISGKYFDRTKETPINSSKPSYDKNARIRLWEESVRYSNLQEKETILPI